jgi:hypothetical protein
MAVFKELDPAVALAAIQGYTDELTEEAAELDKFYGSFKCPRGCGKLNREIDPRHTFSDDSYLVGRSLLRCRNCKYLIDPHTRIVLESGDASKIDVETSPLIQPGEDILGEVWSQDIPHDVEAVRNKG